LTATGALAWPRSDATARRTADERDALMEHLIDALVLCAGLLDLADNQAG